MTHAELDSWRGAATTSSRRGQVTSPHFGCYSNIALLIDFFSSWLEARGVLRGGVGPPPLCSNFTRWVDRCPRSAPKRHLGGRTKPVCTCLDAAAPVKGAHYEWQV